MGKKGALVSIILSIIVAIVIIFAVSGPLYASTNNLWGIPAKLFGTAEPLEKGMSDEQISSDSIRALAEAINAVAGLGTIRSDKGEIQSGEMFPVRYKVTYYTTVGLKDYDDGKKPEKIKKSFSKDFSIEDDSYLIEEMLIFADFETDDAQKYANFYEKARESYSSLKNLAPVEQLNPVYDVELEATYGDGSICRARTYDSEEDKFTNNDLATWGSLFSNCLRLDGCDKNSNGVPGKFDDKSIGKDAKKVLGSKWNQVVANKLEWRFPQGKVTVDSEEGCLDSPVWMECPGIRIYYCGKYGLSSGQSRKLEKEEKDYFLNVDGEIHSRSAIKILRQLDKRFDGLETIDKVEFIKASNAEVVSGERGFASLETDGIFRSVADWFDGTMSRTNLADKKLGDPRISCDEGKVLGNMRLKCDLYGCNLCNFEMTQNHISNANFWISGNFDPEYLIYFQAFPVNEEHPWLRTAFESSLRMNPFAVGASFIERSPEALADEALAMMIDWADISKNQLKDGSYRASIAFASAADVISYANRERTTRFFEKARSVSDSIVRKNPELAERIDAIMENDMSLSSNYKKFTDALGPSFKYSSSASKYNTALALSLVLAKREEMDRKFYSIGNSIAVKSPFSEPKTTARLDAPLSSEAQKYYLQLAKDRGAERFYLASPCKANLKIIKTTCQCAIPAGTSFLKLHKFNGVEVPVLASSVIGDDYTRAITYCINPASLSSSELSDKHTKILDIDCIEVDPIIETSSNNFCHNPDANVWNSPVNDIRAGRWPNHVKDDRN